MPRFTTKYSTPCKEGSSAIPSKPTYAATAMSAASKNATSALEVSEEVKRPIAEYTAASSSSPR